MEQCAKDIKKVSLELGGNGRLSSLTMPTSTKPWKAHWPEIPQRRANLRLRQPFIRAGRVYDRFAEKLQQAVSKLHIGAGWRMASPSGR